MSGLLDRVTGPLDIKNMSQAELLELCSELRSNIIFCILQMQKINLVSCFLKIFKIKFLKN